MTFLRLFGYIHKIALSAIIFVPICRTSGNQRYYAVGFFGKKQWHEKVDAGCLRTKKDNPNELSCLVEQIIELSNPVLEGFVKVVEFSKHFL